MRNKLRFLCLWTSPFLFPFHCLTQASVETSQTSEPHHPWGASVVIKVDKLYFMSEMWPYACGSRWSEEEKLKEKKKMNLFGHFDEEKFYDKVTMLPLKMRTSVLEIWTSVLWYSSFINLSNTLQGTRVCGRVSQTRVLCGLF